MTTAAKQHFDDRDARSARRKRLERQLPNTDIYAIGDVHGCCGLQKKLEQLILAENSDEPRNKLILYLGDLVDRGPDSKGVIDHCLSSLPDGCERLSLCGNHDQLFFEFLLRPSLSAHWLDFGGRETLMSYGVDADELAGGHTSDEEFAQVLSEAIPSAHFLFLQALPVALTVPEAHFVHAGMRIGVPMEDQDDHDLMWIREEFLVDEPASDRLVVHGHSPAPTPRMGPGRIGIDTKAVGGGPLTALHLRGETTRFLSVSFD
ncbi:metallophosphoesterase [uncultured Roseibium sp.]|uniref:metallophosphoesterase n=1 Tax=uncultured Roseibium sp. TaxID=1936171 RepID=UPI002599C7C1|nr:metallophosphoesterase [uncultured Roseibium sp.]